MRFAITLESLLTSQPVDVVSAELIEPDPKTCQHDWHTCPTPPDSAQTWRRCTICSAFGYRKAQHVHTYQCAMKGCTQPAIDRLSGRGPRLAYRWRCRGCLSVKAA